MVDNMTPAIIRLLDPKPLTDEELDEQMELGKAETGTFINFHHPFYIGLHEDVVIPDDVPEESRESLLKLREMMDVRTKIKHKHEYIHRKNNKPDHLIWMFERPYRPTVAYILMRRGLYRDQPNELARFIMDLWIDTETPSSNYLWGEILAGWPTTLAPLGDTDLLDESGRTTVYRGIAISAEEDPDLDLHDQNLSWTTDRARAVWFAKRFSNVEEREVPIVLVGEVANEHVLFCSGDRNESEVVSESVRIIEIQKLEKARA
jgi:hypothetical protein